MESTLNGIYISMRTDFIHNSTIFDLIQIKESSNKIGGRQLYRHNIQQKYEMFLERDNDNSSVLKGCWKNSENSSYNGYCHLIIKDRENVISGIWTGPSASNGMINHGLWILKGPILDGNYNHSKEVKRLSKIDKVHPDILDDIIRKHKDKKDHEFDYQGIKININEGMFSPELGDISQDLLKETMRYISDGDKVLDLGFGSGFYSIYIAKIKQARVTAIDLDNRSFEVAQFNAKQNGVAHRVDFKLCTTLSLLQIPEMHGTFDIIIANLPFTAEEHCKKHKESSWYHSFATTPSDLEQLIFSIQFLLSSNGKAIISFGESGYLNLLYHLVKISNLQIKTIIRKKSKNDVLLVFELSLGDYFNINTKGACGDNRQG